MRSLISLLAAAVCLAALAVVSPAQAWPRKSADTPTVQYVEAQCANGQCANGQCDNGQCAAGQCDNGQCTAGQCEPEKRETGKQKKTGCRRPIDVKVNVSPTPVNVSPTPVNVNLPAPPAQKPAVKPELGAPAVAAVGLAAFGLAVLAGIAVGFHQRASAKKKS